MILAVELQRLGGGIQLFMYCTVLFFPLPYDLPTTYLFDYEENGTHIA
jgi:hypothetical protein